MLDQFLNCLAILYRAGFEIEEKHLSQNFINIIKGLSRAFFNFSKLGDLENENIVNVVQYQEKLNQKISEILNLADIFDHLGFISKTTSLLAQRELLKLKFDLLKKKIIENDQKGQSKENEKKKSEEKKIAPGLENWTKAEKEVLKTIESMGKARPIDVLSKVQFSSRTTKRVLSRLLKRGILKKEVNDNFIFYKAN